jgi:hypothetical protein
MPKKLQSLLNVLPRIFNYLGQELCYPESDIDFAIISKPEDQERLQMAIVSFYERFKGQVFLLYSLFAGVHVSSIVSKAGLRIVGVTGFEDHNWVGEPFKPSKLDISFRTLDQHVSIQNAMKDAFAHWTSQTAFNYIWTQRKLFLLKKLHENDAIYAEMEKEYCLNKQWLKDAFVQKA